MKKRSIANAVHVQNSKIKFDDNNNLQELISRTAALFSAGPSYNFLYNTSTGTTEFKNNSIQTILGIEPELFDCQKSATSPLSGSLKRLCKKELAAQHYLQQKVNPAELTDYKISFRFRLQDSRGRFKTILHQSVPISVSDQSKIEQCLITHTDISRLKLPVNSRVSFISLKYRSFVADNIFACESATDGFAVSFTAREYEVIRLLAEGLNANEIASAIHVSPHTVNTHIKNILNKSDCKNKAELTYKCLKDGLIW